MLNPIPERLVPKDPDYKDRIMASFKRQNAMKTFGIEMTKVEPGQTVLEMTRSDRVLQQQGFVHGGVTAAALDSACGYAALSLSAADREVLTVQYHVNFLAPADGETFVYEGHVIKPGRTIVFTEGMATAIKGGERRTIATLAATLAIIEAPG